MEMKSIIIERNGARAQFHGSWYRGEHTDFIPSKEDLRGDDAFDRYVMEGWRPPAAFITKDVPVTAFGSCFATNISRYLADGGYAVFGRHLSLDAHIIRFGEGMVNSFAIRQQMEWALAGRAFPENLWVSADKEVADMGPQLRDETRDIIARTKVFIITLGLSEIWYDKPTGEAFWRAIPSEIFDESRHGFRLSTVEENRANIATTIDLIRTVRPDASVILTLSPIPLMATFRPISCLTANAVSKAILRVALDQIMSEGRPNVYYYPAYEMITAATFDPFKEDNRHPHEEHLQRVMRTFERHYCC